MIRNPERVRAFEDELLARDTSTYAENLRVFEGLLEWARQCGAFPPADPLEGIEDKIRLAAALNGRRPS